MANLQVSYPFDPTGTATTNLITGEQHPVQEFNYEDFYLIVPLQAPFYTNNLIVQYADPTTPLKTLQEGVDYNLVLPYWAATRSIGLPVYGGILILNSQLTGTISLQYQTIGGVWCANQQYVLQNLAQQMYNPRAVLWDVLTNVQQIFPPINHSLNIDNTYGLDSLNNEIINLANTIANKPTPTIQFITNPTSSQVSTGVTMDQITSLLSSYALISTLQSQYQPLSGMSNYLTTTQAQSAYAAIDGSNVTTGTWNISITGQAASASVANTLVNNASLQNISIQNLTFTVYKSPSPATINSVTNTVIDCSTSNFFPITLTTNTTLSFINVPASGTVYNMTLVITQDATGGRTLTWPSGSAFLWNNATPATPSTGANQTDVYALMTSDGGAHWYISQSFKNAA